MTRDAVVARRLVTVLYADIVASTQKALELDAEVLRAGLAMVNDRARGIIESHGGTVEKFIGDQVMAVFGVPRAHEDDAERAVRAAIQLHRLADGLSGELPFQVSFRIGVNSGDVAAGSGESRDFIVTGLPVIVGARLYPNADPGTILVGDLTKDLTASAVRYGPARSIEGKGTGPLRAWVVEGVMSAVPEQTPRGVSGLHAPLVGRDDELRQIGDAVERTRRTRKPHLLTVFGEAGVGKTRLLAEFTERGRVHTVVGRCLPYGESSGHHAVRSVIVAITASGTAEAGPVERIRAHTAARWDRDTATSIADRLVVLAGFGDAREVLPLVGDDDVVPELRWAFRKLVSRDTDDPLVIVFEDVHWAPSLLLDLIEDAANGGVGPLLICCLARPELAQDPRWQQIASADALAIRLRPLDPSATERLILELLRRADLPDRLITAVVERAGGNPLYVEELLRALIAAGKVRPSEGGWTADGSDPDAGVPETLRGVITARLDLLDPDVRDLLQRASVVGREFTIASVRAIRGDEITRDAIDGAVRSEFIVTLDDGPGTVRSYQFRHALIRDAAYSSLPLRDRKQWHLDAADWLASQDRPRGAGTERIAHHLEVAFDLAHDLRDPEWATIGKRAYSTFIAAAERRRSEGGPDATLYDRAERIALAIGIPDAERANDIAWRAVAAHPPKHADEDQSELFGQLARVRDLGPTTGLAMLLSFASLHLDGGARRDMAEAAVAVARTTGDPTAVTWSMWLLQNGLPREEHALKRRLLAEIIEFAREHGVSAVLAMALQAAQTAEFFDGRFTRARDLLEQADAHAIASGMRAAIAGVHADLAGLYGTLRDGESARRYVDSAVAYAAELSNPIVCAAAHQGVAFGLQGLGMYEEARRYAERGLAALGDRPAPMVRSLMNWSLARSNAMLGDLTRARSHLAEQRRVMPAAAIEHRAWSAWVEGLIEQAAGDVAAAEAAYRHAVETAERSPTPPYGTASWGSFLAQMRESLASVVAANDPSEARTLYGRARDFWSDPLAWRRRAELDARLAALKG